MQGLGTAPERERDRLRDHSEELTERGDGRRRVPQGSGNRDEDTEGGHGQPDEADQLGEVDRPVIRDVGQEGRALDRRDRRDEEQDDRDEHEDDLQVLN